MRRKNSRRIGHDFERWLANWFLQIVYRGRQLFPDARRGRQERSGKDEPDVVNTGFHVEAKRNPRSIRGALEQAIEDADGQIPIVFASLPRLKSTRRNYPHRKIVVMELHEFQEFLVRYKTHNEADV